MKILVIDCETGGFDPSDSSLLSIAGVCLDTIESSIVPCFDLLVREPVLKVLPEAIKFNKINLNNIIEHGQEPKDIVDQIQNSLYEHFREQRIKSEPIALGGHNVWYDAAFLRKMYRYANKNFDKDFLRRHVDTASMLAFLMISRKILEEPVSSDHLFKVAGIKIPKNKRHTAMGDAYATAQAIIVLSEMNKK